MVNRAAVSSSMMDSIKRFSLSGIRIPKEELRQNIRCQSFYALLYVTILPRKILIPESVILMQLPRPTTLLSRHLSPPSAHWFFIISKRDGRHGPDLKARLQELMGEEQIFDLSVLRPHEFVEYGLGCLHE
ncbi:hypothetical protein LXL04_020515 [Taraxacum kok-saghyz]